MTLVTSRGARSAWGVDVGSVKAAKRAGERVSIGGGSMNSGDTVR